jgi:hypothetical protein
MGMGFRRVRGDLPIPTPLQTHGSYPYGFHNPCHTLMLVILTALFPQVVNIIECLESHSLLLLLQSDLQDSMVPIEPIMPTNPFHSTP